MKKIKQLMILSTALLVMSGCDKDFVEINTNPYQVTDVDPALLFAGSQLTHTGGWESEYTIVQQFVNPFNSGATEAFNFNADIDNFNNGKWGLYTGLIKNYIQALALLDEEPDRVNLRSMLRIWKANAIMGLVDTYANVPYSEAGRAYLDGKDYWYPSYDEDAAIYAGLETELREAIAALNPGADYVSSDLFFGDNGSIPTGSAAAQVEKWRKVGNSILLRLGMRYTKVDPSKAESLVSEAFNGGVMTSNDDNVYVTFDGTLNINGTHNGLINNNPYFYYAAEPFVDQLKNTTDPRSPYLIATYADPGNPLADPNPNTDVTQQFGVPVGVISTDLADTGLGYRGTKGAGFDYSQMNVNSIASITAPDFWITYGEVSLLLADAAVRGWIPGGAAQAETYYNNGIRADMDRYALLPNGEAPSATDYASYLGNASVDFAAATTDEERLERINTQLWIVYITNGTQGWANFRRSGYPALSPNDFNNLLQQGANADGFVHRMSYPDYELAENEENYLEAVQAIGGADNLVARVFWDIP